MPPGGGGALRRFICLHQDLYRKKLDLRVNSASFFNIISNDNGDEESSDTDIVPMPPLALFDFNRNDDAIDGKAIEFGTLKGGWRLSDDAVIGGYSSGSAVLIDPSMQHEKDHGKSKNDTDKENDNMSPFIRWSGILDTRIGKKSRVQRSGFCAIRSPDCSLPPFSYGVPLQNNYNALEIRCRTDGRIYAVNLKVSTYMEDDLYQGFINVKLDDVPPSTSSTQDCGDDVHTGDNSSTMLSDWITLVMPFRDFVLTSSGRVRVQQRDLDGGIIFQNLGFTLMDGTDGPFLFDIARIRAINYDDGKVLNDI